MLTGEFFRSPRSIWRSSSPVNGPCTGCLPLTVRTFVLIRPLDAHDRLQIPLDRLLLTTTETLRAPSQAGLRSVSKDEFARTSDGPVGTACFSARPLRPVHRHCHTESLRDVPPTIRHQEQRQHRTSACAHRVFPALVQPGPYPSRSLPGDEARRLLIR